MHPFDRIPDGIEPIVGYRGWIYALYGSCAELHPMSSGGDATDPSPWDGAESGWVDASCAADPVELEHVPGWSCTCGFYATKSQAPIPKSFLAVLKKAGLAVDSPSEDGVERGWIFGRVELAGKIIEHEHGYRAQRARIAELNPLDGDQRNSSHLAALLSLPIGDPVSVVEMPLSPDPSWSPPDGPSTLRLRVRDWVQDLAA
jgi:hypothetical protein